MRIAVVFGMSLVVAGCAHGGGGQPQPTHTSTSPTPHTTTTSAEPSAAPAAGAPISEVIAWVEAGRATDVAGYHSATRDGATTDLGDEVAFTSAAGSSGAARCVTTGNTLSCLVDLVNPPPRPPDVYGQWKGNWIDFDGANLQVGSAHGDPGPFLRGDGPEVPDGATLAFGDYRCRADETGLFCVNYAHRSAARLASAGVEPYGCLHPVPPPDGAGKYFSC